MNLINKNKRGVSVIIGYVLLISTAIILSIIIYSWIKTYIPKDSEECPEGVSISLIDYDYEKEEWLNLTLKNNGRFNIGGLFIKASNKTESEQEIATMDMDRYALGEQTGQGAIIFADTIGSNPLKPGEEEFIFLYLGGNEDVEQYVGEIYFINIIPTRWIEIDEREKFTSCGNSKISEEIDS